MLITSMEIKTRDEAFCEFVSSSSLSVMPSGGLPCTVQRRNDC